MSARHAICLVIDGLRAAALGAYGNTTYPTPQLDALAARGVVADWLWGDATQLEDFYRGLWGGVHALRPAGDSTRVLSELDTAGVRQLLLTDEPWLADLTGRWAQGRNNADTADLSEPAETTAPAPAADLEATAIGQFFTSAIEQVTEQFAEWQAEGGARSSVTWLHCRGLQGAWDAPQELREQYWEEGDPEVATGLARPEGCSACDDPDQLLEFRVAYAAQVAVLDACVGALLAAIEELLEGQETLVMLTGARGFALGEHGTVGPACTDLLSERVHLPWLIVPSGSHGPLPRLGSFSQVADLSQTLLDWLDVQGTAADGRSCVPWWSGEPYTHRTQAVSIGSDGQRSLRTPAWLLRQRADQTLELFSKPDDRWESNDVADRCPEIVEQLREELAEFEKELRVASG
jgi:arylsulfatase A-like enzyme